MSQWDAQMPCGTTGLQKCLTLELSESVQTTCLKNCEPSSRSLPMFSLKTVIPCAALFTYSLIFLFKHMT